MQNLCKMYKSLDTLSNKTGLRTTFGANKKSARYCIPISHFFSIQFLQPVKHIYIYILCVCTCQIWSSNIDIHEVYLLYRLTIFNTHCRYIQIWTQPLACYWKLTSKTTKFMYIYSVKLRRLSNKLSLQTPSIGTRKHVNLHVQTIC